MKRRDEGHLRKHSDGKRWIARLRYTDADGSRREKKRICDTHERAKAEIDALRSEVIDEAAPRKTYRELDEFYRREYVHAARYVGGQKVSGFRQKLGIIGYYLDSAMLQAARTRNSYGSPSFWNVSAESRDSILGNSPFDAKRSRSSVNLAAFRRTKRR